MQAHSLIRRLHWRGNERISSKMFQMAAWQRVAVISQMGTGGTAGQ